MFHLYRKFTEATLRTPEPRLMILPADHVNHPSTTKPSKMAPRLPQSTKEMTFGMITSSGLNAPQMAEAANCDKRTIKRHRSNIRMFGSVAAPLNKGGRPRSLTPLMIQVLCDHLLEKPQLYLDEMVVFLWDEFEVLVTIWSIRRALQQEGWSKKAAKQKAKGRNADLRDAYCHYISDFCSYHLVYVDESGCDKRIGFRKTGWSPRGTTPSQVAKFRRDQRYRILPAYAQDGIVLSRVYKGSTDSSIFEYFIEELLHHFGKLPEPKSVLVMDNASFHHSERVEQLCSLAGVKLIFLPPCSPDLNPLKSSSLRLNLSPGGIGTLTKTILIRVSMYFWIGVLVLLVEENKVQRVIFGIQA